jgi:hypothetical protein
VGGETPNSLAGCAGRAAPCANAGGGAPNQKESSGAVIGAFWVVIGGSMTTTAFDRIVLKYSPGRVRQLITHGNLRSNLMGLRALPLSA